MVTPAELIRSRGLNVTLYNLPASIELVEVAPRDGFQSIVEPLPTSSKIDVIEALIAAGLKRIEIGSFVSPKAIPQMADTGELVRYFKDRPDVRFSALVPNLRGANMALEAGVKELVYVISVSLTHNMKNVRQTHEQSLAGLAEIAEQVRQSTLSGRPTMRLDLGTCFDCPFDGLIKCSEVANLLSRSLELMEGIDVEIALCDTTGRASPAQVGQYFAQLTQQFTSENITWAFHGHDTYGMGVANAMFAIQNGATAIDAAAAGLGGCPFAPGATGNTATEDLLYAFNGGGIETGVDLMKLLAAADLIAALPGGQTASHMRSVPRSRIAA